MLGTRKSDDGALEMANVYGRELQRTRTKEDGGGGRETRKTASRARSGALQYGFKSFDVKAVALQGPAGFCELVLLPSVFQPCRAS